MYTLLALAFLPLIFGTPLPLTTDTINSTISCSDVHIITARASTESPGEGAIGALAALIQSGTSQSVSRTSIDYPALLNPYAPSVASGVSAMKSVIQQTVDACPSAKIVLLGYSQGAECISDSLGGGGGGLLLTAKTPALDYDTYGQKIVAGVMYGDPRYIISESSFHVGTCFQNGLFPRLPDQLLTKYTSVLKTYCDFGDPFCCSGLDVLAHLDYVDKYNTLALAFVLNKIGG